MSASPRHLITPEEYLRLERAVEYRSEFLHGDIFAMAGTSSSHNYIAGNIYNFFRNALKNGNCKVYMADMRVSPNADGYFYPDVVVACGKIHFLDEKEDTLLNPTVIVEVLSKSTSNYDHGDKFSEYRTSKTLRDYLLVSQDSAMVEHHSKQPDGWLLQERKLLSDQIPLASLNLSLSLDVIYEGIDFTAPK